MHAEGAVGIIHLLVGGVAASAVIDLYFSCAVAQVGRYEARLVEAGVDHLFSLHKLFVGRVAAGLLAPCLVHGNHVAHLVFVGELVAEGQRFFHGDCLYHLQIVVIDMYGVFVVAVVDHEVRISVVGKLFGYGEG